MTDEARIEGYYNNYQKNKNKLKIGSWIIVDEEYYLANKDKIKIINIKLYSGENESTKRPESYVLAETKSDYIIIKYSANFIAVNICQREYELHNSINLVMVNENATRNIENNSGDVPNIKTIIKTLGWKATRKAIKDLEEFE
jgi:predicted transport protein